jgi:hypothetical protein
MKAVVFTFFGIISITSMSASAQQELSPVELNARIVFLKQELAERKICLKYRASGVKQGAFDYRLRFPSCTDFLLAGNYIERFFPDPEKDLTLYEQCYDSGYRYGYVMENIKQWAPCAVEMNRIIEEANQESIEKCRSLAREEKSKLLDLEAQIRNDFQNGMNSELAKKYAEVIFFSKSGFGHQAWDDLIKVTKKSQMDTWSCHYILNKEVFGVTP